MNNFEGKNEVVTGGGGGIGEAMCRLFASKGMNVVVSDIDSSAAEKVADTLAATGVKSFAVTSDVSDRDSVKNLANKAFDEMGNVHILCNNAGVVSFAPIHEQSERDWDWVVGVDLNGVLYGVQSFLPRMLANGEDGHIINTSSSAGLYAFPGIGPYVVSKYGVVAVSETMYEELANTKIGVSVLCPSGVQTQIMHSQRNRPNRFGGPTDPGSGQSAPDESISPDVVANRVFEAIENDYLYILTHTEIREGVEKRFKAILDSFDRLEASGGTGT